MSHLRPSDFNTVYITDGLQQVVTFINDNHISSKSNAA